jgi:hypothetical protein
LNKLCNSGSFLASDSLSAHTSTGQFCGGPDAEESGTEARPGRAPGLGSLSAGTVSHEADAGDAAAAARSYASYAQIGSEEVTAEVIVAPMLARGPVTLAMLDAGYEIVASSGGDWVDRSFIEWRDAAACGGLHPEYLYPLLEAIFLAMANASPKRFLAALRR